MRLYGQLVGGQAIAQSLQRNPCGPVLAAPALDFRVRFFDAPTDHCQASSLGPG
ncbi:hypothetical protein H6F90_05640 [Trichocoleus sp. FACHB-591]|uniref:hypothetical protein n=1 Tax=Trichocoleus sp. FACHB-591 TaxID=2692872 RepID=UPI0016822967|nr:hypothetical protein [Trichocoleus sp. FACHB-591]MBD2094632.1 hypothetical protein [Trichocoleus sp. FACHB-591]